MKNAYHKEALVILRNVKGTTIYKKKISANFTLYFSSEQNNNWIENEDGEIIRKWDSMPTGLEPGYDPDIYDLGCKYYAFNLGRQHYLTPLKNIGDLIPQ